MTKVILCGKSHGCCPVAERKGRGDVVTITDDDKNVVTMSYDQWLLLKKAEL